MAKIHVKRLRLTPAFDLQKFIAIHGVGRIEHELLEYGKPIWDDWVDRLHAYKLSTSPEPDASGLLLVHLTESVEKQVDEVWDESPSQGLFLHNLAITMVMIAAGELVPELNAWGCAPLPQPSKDIRRAFKKLGLEWNPEGSINRKYAVMTNVPYRGGCELCMLEPGCPKSRMAGAAQSAGS